MKSPNKIWIVVFLYFITLIISIIPFGNIIFYPIDLFATYIHEISHAFTTIITGGKAYQISISPDTSGFAMSSGGWRFFSVQAGYLGTAIVGGILLYLTATESPKIAKYTLGFITLIMLLCLIFFARDLFTIAATIFYIIVIGFVVMKANDFICQIFLGFLAIQCCFNSIESIKIVLGLAMKGASITSDAYKMQEMTFIPAPVWAIFWFLISLVIFGLVLFKIYKHKPLSNSSDIDIL